MPSNTEPLVAGSEKHKAARWKRYQIKKAGSAKALGYEEWSKKYDTVIRNNTDGLAREAHCRAELKGVNLVIGTPFGNRQIDICRPQEGYAGQLKTGPIDLTEQAKVDLRKDAWLVQQGFTVEYILEKGASESLIKAAKRAGIMVHIGPKIALAPDQAQAHAAYVAQKAQQAAIAREAARVSIHQAISTNLPKVSSLRQLTTALTGKGIDSLTYLPADKPPVVAFTKGKHSFSAHEIDPNFSAEKLQQVFATPATSQAQVNSQVQTTPARVRHRGL